MKQSDLNRAVARATGESISTIKRLGFLLSDPAEALDPEDDQQGPYVIDWDELSAQRDLATAWSRQNEPVEA